jgi:hypothetical protein
MTNQQRFDTIPQFAYGMGRSRRWKQNNDSVYRNLSERWVI